MVSSLYRRKTFQDLPSKVSQQAVKHPWPRRKVRPVGSTPRYFLVGQTPIFDVLPTYLVVSSHLQTGYETNICKKQVLSLLVKNQLNVFLVLLKFHHFFIHFLFLFFPNWRIAVSIEFHHQPRAQQTAEMMSEELMAMTHWAAPSGETLRASYGKMVAPQ